MTSTLCQSVFSVSTSGYSDIAEFAAGILRNRPTSSESEAGLISRNDNFLQLVAKLAGLSIVRDSATQSTVHRTRPDAALLHDNVPVVLVEEKAADADLATAVQELQSKFNPPPIYKTARVLGMAIAANTLKLCVIDRSHGAMVRTDRSCCPSCSAASHT